jgi:hypothetical protein
VESGCVGWVGLVWVGGGCVGWVGTVWVGVGGSIGTQFPLSALSTISSRVALVNLSVPLEDNPPALGVQYFTVRQRSVTVTLPVWPGGQDTG